MGFFSEIADEVRRNEKLNRPAASQRPVPAPEQPARVHAAPVPTPFPDPVQAVPEPETLPSPDGPLPIPEPVSEQPVAGTSKPDPVPEQPKPEQSVQALAIDLTDTADAADEAERRKAHEAAEAKRKAEFDARQARKKAARQKQLDRIKAMNGDELLAAAAGRVAADTERLTRRNMKDAVSEHIQAKCREDAAFAMLVMDPDKSMANCFQYINRKALEYAEQEMKDNNVGRVEVYGLDIPNGLCYQWAEDYFNDPDAKEDRKDDEKFVPKPYVPAAPKKTQSKAVKKPLKKKPAGKPPEKAAGPAMEQISLI